MTDAQTPARRPKPDQRKPVVWELRLCGAGPTAESIRAFANLKVRCEERLKDRYLIEMIELLKHTQLARGHQIVALPTPVIRLQKPIREICGPVQHQRSIGGFGPAGGGLT